MSNPEWSTRTVAEETKPDSFTSFTFLDWSDESRPILEVHPEGCNGVWGAQLSVGGHHALSIDDNKPSLKEQLEGYAEIFKAAAESL